MQKDKLIKTGELIIDKKNIDLFRPCSWQRLKRNSKVERFYYTILNETFSAATVITVNRVGENYNIINGNHRVEAIKLYLSKYPEGSIKVICEEYKDMTHAEETKLYDSLAIETPQSVDDYLYIHRSEIPIYDMLQKDFPLSVKVYDAKTNLKFKHILQGILLAKKDYISSNALGREKMFELGKTLNEKDVECLKEFVLGYVETVGKPLDNVMYNPSILINMIKIYFRNFLNPHIFVKKEDMANRMKGLYSKMVTDAIILACGSRGSTRELLKEINDRIYYLANKSKLNLALV